MFKRSEILSAIKTVISENVLDNILYLDKIFYLDNNLRILVSEEASFV